MKPQHLDSKKENDHTLVWEAAMLWVKSLTSHHKALMVTLLPKIITTIEILCFFFRLKNKNFKLIQANKMMISSIRLTIQNQIKKFLAIRWTFNNKKHKSCNVTIKIQLKSQWNMKNSWKYLTRLLTILRPDMSL